MKFNLNFFDDPAISWREKGFIGHLVWKYKIGQRIPLTYEVQDIYRINKNDIAPFNDEEILDYLLMYGIASMIDEDEPTKRDSDGILWCTLLDK